MAALLPELGAGINPKDLPEHLGNASVQTTYAIYAHAMPKRKKTSIKSRRHWHQNKLGPFWGQNIKNEKPRFLESGLFPA